MHRGYPRVARYLIHCNDLRREYDLKEGDPSSFLTTDVVERMTGLLQIELQKIRATPEKRDPFVFEAVAPIPIAPATRFWTYAEGSTVARIAEGQADRESLPPARRYALQQSTRLLHLGCSAEGLPADSQTLHDGYIWCALDPESIPREARPLFSRKFLIVEPTRANDIYVVDQAAYDLCRQELITKLESEDPARTRFTEAEVDDMDRARAATLTPWHEYEGDFQKPIVLIGRELGLDEVSLEEAL